MKYDADKFNYCLCKTNRQNKLVNTAEECAELIQCCTKQLRGRDTNTEHLKEEMADVLLNIYLLAYAFDIDMSELKEIGERKLERFKKRTENGEPI